MRREHEQTAVPRYDRKDAHGSIQSTHHKTATTRKEQVVHAPPPPPPPFLQQHNHTELERREKIEPDHDERNNNSNEPRNEP